MTYSCANVFLNTFRDAHLRANQRFFSKHLILVQDSDKELHTTFFEHPITYYDLPQTMIVSLTNNTIIDFWYRRHHEKEGQKYNQFFIENRTFFYHDKPFFPAMNDLTGVELNVATINYPPYTFYEFVVSCFLVFKLISQKMTLIGTWNRKCKSRRVK